MTVCTLILNVNGLHIPGQVLCFTPMGYSMTAMTVFKERFVSDEVFVF